jgi:hypothetical protein
VLRIAANIAKLPELLRGLNGRLEKRTLRRVQPMSALPLKADIDPQRRNVCFGSTADIVLGPRHVRSASNSRHQNWLGLRSALQLRQLGNIAGNPPRLTLC